MSSQNVLGPMPNIWLLLSEPAPPVHVMQTRASTRVHTPDTVQCVGEGCACGQLPGARGAATRLSGASAGVSCRHCKHGLDASQRRHARLLPTHNSCTTGEPPRASLGGCARSPDHDPGKLGIAGRSPWPHPLALSPLGARVGGDRDTTAFSPLLCCSKPLLKAA
jgi:hypothetical protein